MMRIEAAGATDVGRQREANEDAFHLGDSIFAVADGMGGHKAGEIASAAAVAAIQKLDGKVFGQAEAAQEGLRAAFHAANERVAQMADEDSDYRGMGTTLTVAMGEGQRLHVAHIGDSRAYLLRDGTFGQLTSDHTLVQHLVDEGQITPAEAATHPKRSIITRAIGVSEHLDVDAMTIELEVGDTLVLCSDGLTGVVDDRGIKAAIEEEPTLQATVDRLVAEANAGGGPDNITVVALRAVDDDLAGATTPQARDDGNTDTLTLPASETLRISSIDSVSDEDDWPERLQRFNQLGIQRPSDDDVRFSLRRRRTMATALTVAVLLIVALVGGRWLLGRSYYVGIDGNRVAIFQGVPASFGPIDFSWVAERTDLLSADVPEFQRLKFAEGVAAVSLADAQRIIEQNRPDPDTASPSATSGG